MKKILYCGDSPLGGPANYLLGLLRYHGYQTLHIAPGQKLSPKNLSKDIRGIIFSDYSRDKVSEPCQKIIEQRVSEGTGFLMVGGWGSFSGPFGHWKGSRIERILPVFCSAKDDRLNFPGGALILPAQKASEIFGKLSFSKSPAICGINEVRPKTASKIILTLRPVLNENGRVKLSARKFPFLVVDSSPQKRVGALTTDFAPHWCGGFVDWGGKTIKIKVSGNIGIEIGSQYAQFAGQLLKWLCSL